jgi:hypothetical protein
MRTFLRQGNLVWFMKLLVDVLDLSAEVRCDGHSKRHPELELNVISHGFFVDHEVVDFKI